MVGCSMIVATAPLDQGCLVDNNDHPIDVDAYMYRYAAACNLCSFPYINFPSSFLYENFFYCINIQSSFYFKNNSFLIQKLNPYI
jgi:hypothetical protein